MNSILTLIIAKSGRGKSTAIRNMNPDTTVIFNVMGKALPFPGAGKKYVEGKNLFSVAEAASIIQKMMSISATRPEITDIIIDDAQYIMATEFMRQALVKGFDKWSVMAQNIWNLLVVASKLREGLRVFVLTHEEETATERKMKTLGKLLDEKLSPEGLATIVLFGDIYVDDNQQVHGYFQTKSDGLANAKSPMGMFPFYIENDLAKISQRIMEYYEGIELTNTKIKFEDVVMKK